MVVLFWSFRFGKLWSGTPKDPTQSRMSVSCDAISATPLPAELDAVAKKGQPSNRWDGVDQGEPQALPKRKDQNQHDHRRAPERLRVYICVSHCILLRQNFLQSKALQP